MDYLPSSTLYYQSIGFIITLMLCALFSFIETSITALRIFKLQELANSTKGYKSLFKILEEHPNQILFTILIANSLVNASCTALITSVMQDLFLKLNLSEGLGLTAGVAIATCAIVIFGEIIPKNIARNQGNKLLKYTLGITYLTYYVLRPIVIVITKFANLAMAPFLKNSHENVAPSEKELSFLIDYTNKKGIIDKQKTDMLLSIFKLSEKPIRENLVPEPEIVCIESNSTLQDAITLFTKHQYSRLPVYENRVDNIVGIIYLKDILYKNLPESTKIKTYVRPIMFIPESMKMSQLLKEFIENRRHMAIALNEFGGIEGLITLEDVLEQIVGPITDEHEQVSTDIIKIDDKLLVNASTNLEELKKVLNIDFETNAISVGGFIIEKMQRLPLKGEKLIYKNYIFKIENTTPKRILKVLIKKENS